MANIFGMPFFDQIVSQGEEKGLMVGRWLAGWVAALCILTGLEPLADSGIA